MKIEPDSIILNGEGSLQRQLYQALRQPLLSGLWPSGALLPSSRVLASELGLSRNTVNAALAQLVAEGYLQGQAGRGYCIITQLPDQFFQAHAFQDSHQLSIGPRQPTPASTYVPSQAATPYKTGLLEPGVPDLAAFPYRIWQRLLQRHADRPKLGVGGDVLGYLPLRQALCLYLQQSRQVHCNENQILITAGAQQGLYVAAMLVAARGDQVLMESPGYGRLRQALQLQDLQINYLNAAGPEGVAAEELNHHHDCKALFLTPGHQYPMGGIMPLPQRLAILQWARQQGCWLVEDDYDSEFQFKHRPIASLQGLAQGEGVIFVGSFSKTMQPALRLGYLVAPAALIRRAADIVQAIHGDVQLLTQAALADFISEGHFSRHLRKMRKLYQQKQQLAQQLAAQYLPGWQLRAMHAGLHLVLLCPDDMQPSFDGPRLLQQLAAQGYAPAPLSKYQFNDEKTKGLVIGIANLSHAELERGLQLIATFTRLP
ncbi:PLP-dependent aminotransferase family protein [Rheinheimera riviphila]|uniref:PLP-dependent aminotransferase family protein n=1 Tax=Rheinheimera riviphila TaxID=1834037 RepID=A0A437QLP4_9GAMM|nr:PLP-dependent aminotransferase family protein [Rheinheimera riviphila]RVU35438.1 PLP-dependent aminotransferase family protein [Rheinheimera riviphila]